MPTLEGLLLRREQLRAELAKAEADIQMAQAAWRNEGIAKVEVPIEFRLPAGHSYAAMDC